MTLVGRRWTEEVETAVLAALSFLPPRFGLDGPALLDVLAIGLLAYACFED